MLTDPGGPGLAGLPVRESLGSESAIDVKVARRFAELPVQRRAPIRARAPRARKRAINSYDITPPWRLMRIMVVLRLTKLVARSRQLQTVQNQQLFLVSEGSWPRARELKNMAVAIMICFECRIHTAHSPFPYAELEYAKKYAEYH